mgnify:CR=1 FL=1
MQGNYLIPANSKRAQLIFNIFRPIDLVIAIVGASLTILLFIIIQPYNLVWARVTLLPLLICAFLVLPIPNYQNMLCVIQNVYKFYFTERQEFKWKGWCAKDEFKE